MHIKRVAVVLIILAGCLLAGCSMDRWTEVEPGEYATIRGVGVAGEAAAKIQKIAVDRDKGTATFTLVDGSQILASFVPRERANWPAGCPSNIGSTRMEVLDIQKDTLIIGSTMFNDPILLRNCPPDPVRIALREDGRIGGSGGACSGADECILFGR
jgi:hypothetical protein